MGALKHMALWSELRSLTTGLLLVTLAVCLVRAPDQPGIAIGLGSTSARVVPGDVLLVALAGVAFAMLLRTGLPRSAWVSIGTAGSLCLLILGTGAWNGATAFVAGAKFVELAALGLGVVALIRRRLQLEAIVDVLLLFTLVADLYGIERFISGGGGRQSSFLGEHDFAALAALPLVYGLAVVFEPGARQRRAWIAIAIGAVGCVLGAALASLLGLYLGAVVLVIVALTRGAATRRALLVTALVVSVVTGGTLALRAGELGFLQSWFGKPPSRPGQYAASWSQRLIYTYVGGRVFLAHPLVGSGWYGELPPKVFVRYLPDARRRFSDQPRRYFPPANSDFVPQQTWDQILYELGLAGAAIALSLFVTLVLASRRAVRIAFTACTVLPAVWLGSLIGALSGDGLFGGTPVATLFWLVAGVAIATPLFAGGRR